MDTNRATSNSTENKKINYLSAEHTPALAVEQKEKTCSAHHGDKNRTTSKQLQEPTSSSRHSTHTCSRRHRRRRRHGRRRRPPSDDADRAAGAAGVQASRLAAVSPEGHAGQADARPGGGDRAAFSGEARRLGRFDVLDFDWSRSTVGGQGETAKWYGEPVMLVTHLVFKGTELGESTSEVGRGRGGCRPSLACLPESQYHLATSYSTASLPTA